MTSPARYAVIGAGNGGCALAAELALLGRDIVLYEHLEFEERLRPLRALGGIGVESRVGHFCGGIGTHFAPLPLLATDPSVVADRDIIAVVVPGQHHDRVIDALLPHLRPGQLVLLAPGGVGGTLLWAERLHRVGFSDILLAQTADLSYAGHRSSDAKVVVSDKKRRILVGVFPQCRHAEAMARLGTDFPELALAANALDAGLQGPGMLVHPLPMLMNAVRIDRDHPFTYDAYDITPSVARAVCALDRERMALVAALGGQAKPIEAILGDFYGVSGIDFYDTVRKVPAYQGSAAPADFSHRYIAEEVPTQIVPTCGIARVLGVPTPMMEATVALASAVAGEAFGQTGWGTERLGIACYGRTGLLRYLETG